MGTFESDDTERILERIANLRKLVGTSDIQFFTPYDDGKMKLVVDNRVFTGYVADKIIDEAFEFYYREAEKSPIESAPREPRAYIREERSSMTSEQLRSTLMNLRNQLEGLTIAIDLILRKYQ